MMAIQQVIVSYYDLQWSNDRTMIFTGILFGLISCLAAIDKRQQRRRAPRVGATTVSGTFAQLTTPSPQPVAPRVSDA